MSSLSFDQPPFERAMTVLGVRDMAASLEFYSDKLGFSVVASWGEPPGFAIVQRGLVTLGLQAREDNNVSGIGGWSTYIYVNDVDALYEEFKAAGVNFERDIEDSFYGCRDFDVLDPDGNGIMFGQVDDRGPVGPGLSTDFGRDGRQV